jgi:hypothetical protein
MVETIARSAFVTDEYFRGLGKFRDAGGLDLFKNQGHKVLRSISLLG